MPRRIEHQTRTNEVASRGTTKDSIIKVSDAVVARPRGNEPLKDGKNIPESTNNNVSATERKIPARGKT